MAKAPVTAPPVHAPPAKPPPAPVTSAAGLQSRIGATGVQKLMASRAGEPAPGTGTAIPEAVNDQAAAPGKKGKPAHGKAPHGKPEAAGEEKPKAEAGAAQEEGGGGGAAAVAVPVKMHMPEPPTKPSKATMARIKGVKGRLGGKAKAQGTLPPADKQVGDVKKAVTPPEAERIAKAREELIAELKPAPSPEILELCEKIRKVIRAKRPPDEDALVKAEPAKEAMDAGNTLNSNIENQNKAVTANYGPMEGPPTPGPEQKGKPLEPQPNASPTPATNAKAAVPDKVPPQSVSLDKDAEESRKKAEAAGMNKPAAALVQSGPIAEAREAQGELDQAAKEDPAKVLAKQEEALAKAQQDMTALQDRALAALVQSRASTAGKTSQRQKSMVGTDEEKRTAASNEAKEIFNQAQSDVRAQLKDLIPTAMADWEASKARITSQFKYDLKIVADKVKKRHEGVGGFFRGLKDSAFGLPDWATEAYDDAEYVFSESVIKVLKRISAHVDLVIKTCEAIIKAARERIKKIMADLPPSLQKWAEQEQAKFDKDLDKLGDEVVAERNSFNKQLTESASQAVDEVRAEIADLRKKAGGLVGRIVDAVKRFVDDPVKFIIEGLLELLGISPPAFWAVVAKIKKVVRDIIDDPVGFANNLLKGLGQGFSQFFDNFAGHMIRGFLTWLLGDLKDVQIPKEISLKSIITFFLQLMGITWPNIRKILAKKIGEKNVALIERVYSLITMLIEKGPEGIYEMIKEKLDPQSILDQVIDMAVEFMVTAIAKQVAARLLLLFNPAGAILQAIEAIYRILKWVFQNAAKIFTLIETIVNGLADIIAGNVGGFANAVEKGLAMLIAPVLGFVADYFSLGDLPKMVAKQIKGFREWILGKIEAGFDWVIAKGKALLAKLGIGKKDEEKGGSAHEQAVKSVAAKLSQSNEDLEYDDLRKAKMKEAETLAAEHNKTLAAEKVKMRILFQDPAKDTEDQDLDFEVVISPNDSKAKAAAKAAADEPIAGKHPLKRPAKSKKGGESHHVPAKALGTGIASVLEDVAASLRRGDWKDDQAAKAAARALSKRAKDNRAMAKPPGDGLSAILLSPGSHKGDAGVHSTASAPILAKLAKNPAADAILLCKRTTAKKIGSLSSFISVNPQIPGWRAFLADVRRRLDDKKFKSDPTTARNIDSAAELLLQDAEAEFKKSDESSDEYIQSNVIERVNETIDKAPEYGFTMGSAIVAHAMKTAKDGTPQGQKAALGDLRTSYEETWQPFRDEIVVDWP